MILDKVFDVMGKNELTATMAGKRNILVAGGFEHNTFTSDMRLQSILYIDGSLTELGTMETNFNLGFICTDPSRHMVYALDTRPESGAVGAWRVNCQTGQLMEEGQVFIVGAQLGLHCVVSPDRRYLAAAYGNSHEVVIIRLQENGDLGNITDRYRLPEGTHTLPRQQSGPAPHQVVFDRHGKYLFIPDIHTDRLYCMSFDDNTGRIFFCSMLSFDGGEGPRHLAVSADNRMIYLLSEMGTNLFAISFEEKTGKMEILERHILVPEEYKESHDRDQIQGGSIDISPDGKWIMVTVRCYSYPDGTDRIYIFEILPGDGRIEEAGQCSSDGVCPRMAAFCPDGIYILIGNKFSNQLICKEFNAESGKVGKLTGVIYSEEIASFCVADV